MSDDSLLTSAVPRSLETKSKLFGLDLADVLILFLNLSIESLVFGGTRLKMPMVVGTTAVLVFLLLIFKRGKPDLYLKHYFWHLRSNSHSPGNAEDSKYRAHGSVNEAAL